MNRVALVCTIVVASCHGRSTPATTSTVALDGVVLDPDGHGVLGAHVALVGGGGIARVAVTDDRGTFHFGVARGERWSVSAQRSPWVASYLEPTVVAGDQRVQITLARPEGVRIRGKVVGATWTKGMVEVLALSQNEGDAWAVPITSGGTFEIVVPEARGYQAQPIGDAYIGTTQIDRTRPVLEMTLEVSPLVPPPSAVTDWLRSAGTRVSTSTPSADVSDVAPIAEMAGSARLVALGEATHASRELFQLKHRVLQALVERGFTIFAIEASQPECRAIEAYIQGGTRDDAAIREALTYWVWQTEEVVALIEWMRAWNADPRHRDKLHFVGFDIQSAHVAKRTVADLVRRVLPARAEALLAPFATIAPDDEVQALVDATAAEWKALDDGFAQIARELPPADTDADVRHDLDVLRRWLAYEAEWDDAIRDRAMADNLTWILERNPGKRVVAWAHNLHVAKDATTAMGHHLRESLGADYVSIGFVFHRGGFRARAPEQIKTITLEPAAVTDLSTAFARVGAPILAADLRTAPAGPVADWLAAPHPMRETGWLYQSDDALTRITRLSRRFDIAIYVDAVTPSRALAQDCAATGKQFGARPAPCP